MIFFYFSKRTFDFCWGDDSSFWFSLALLGFLIGMGSDWSAIPFLFFSFFLFLSFFLPMELSCLLNLLLRLLDHCDLKDSRLKIFNLKAGWKCSRWMPVCDARVSSDVFESARIMLWVGSLWLESTRLSVHTFVLLIESARMSSSGLGWPITF